MSLTADFHGCPNLPETTYHQRQRLRTARHCMELIALLMLILAAVLAGWSVHQSYAWQARPDSSPNGAAVSPAAERDWLQAQRWPRTAGRRPQPVDRDQTGTAGPMGAHPGRAAETLPLARQDLGRTAPNPRRHGTSGEYRLAAGVFLLALLCCAASLRRASAATQLTALVAAELFTLIGVGVLSALPAAL